MIKLCIILQQITNLLSTHSFWHGYRIIYIHHKGRSHYGQLIFKTFKTLIKLTSITEKALGTYKCILESADVCVILCGLAWRRKQGNSGKTTHRPWTGGRPLPRHMPIPRFEPGSQRCQANLLPVRYLCP